MVSFPEAVLVAALGLVLTGVRLHWTQLVLFGVLQAGVSYEVLVPSALGENVLR